MSRLLWNLAYSSAEPSILFQKEKIKVEFEVLVLAEWGTKTEGFKHEDILIITISVSKIKDRLGDRQSLNFKTVFILILLKPVYLLNLLIALRPETLIIQSYS